TSTAAHAVGPASRRDRAAGHAGGAVNVWGLAQQIVYVLSPNLFTWTGAPTTSGNDGTAVLSRLVVGPETPPDFFQRDAVAPFGLLHPEAVTDHPDHPADLIDEARFTLYLFAANATEQAGSAALMGGNRYALSGSRGRGLLEAEPLV